MVLAGKRSMDTVSTSDEQLVGWLCKVFMAFLGAGEHHSQNLWMACLLSHGSSGNKSSGVYKRHYHPRNDIFSEATLCERINALWHLQIAR